MILLILAVLLKQLIGGISRKTPSIGGSELLIRPLKIDVEGNNPLRYLVNIWARIVRHGL